MMLQVENIVTLYGLSMVIQGLSLSVEAGEVVALLGRNGAGKTTTLRSIMGLTPPRSGSVRFEGVDIAGKPPHHIARLGISYVPDDRRIFPDLTVEQNLELARRVAPRTEGPWTIAEVYKLFPVLEGYRHRGGTQLSGGEQKMLALGRALVQNPRLLLLDEAVEGLAPLIVREFMLIIREISASGITILLADQNLKFARQVAQRGYIIDKGRIEYHDEIEKIWANEDIVRRYLVV
ncbi:MAG: ABC transporter ATP-binding protein [Anaerolineae bacterium]